MLALVVSAFALSSVMRSTAAQSADDACITDPTMASCDSYVYSEDQVIADIQLNCQQMPWMIGCSVWDACMDGSMGEDNRYCNPFSVLSTQCVDQGMEMMGGCLNYVGMCRTGSMVPQCDEFPPIPNVVSTVPSQNAVINNCATHSMPGCNTCTAQFSDCPDTLSSLSQVCQAHRMEDCGPYYRMCTVAGPDLDHFCSSRGGRFDPPMRMYFHTGIRDIVLFRQLVPENDGEYAGVVIAVLITGILAGGLRVLRSVWETRERMQANAVIREAPTTVAQQSIFVLPSAEVPAHVARSFLSLLVITLDYALMLIAMTFNVGIFFAVVCGLALGILFFGHITRRYTERLQAQSLLTAQRCDCAEDDPSGKIHADIMYDSASKRTADSVHKQTEPSCCAHNREAPVASVDAKDICCDTKTAAVIADGAQPLPSVQGDCCSGV